MRTAISPRLAMSTFENMRARRFYAAQSANSIGVGL